MDPQMTYATTKTLECFPQADNLPLNLRYFLGYHLTEISHRHYFLMGNGRDRFVHHDLIVRAFQFEPLLHAIVAFSAYLWSVKQPRGNLYTIFQSYQNSVSTLRAAISRGEMHEALLLTSLQLCTFEVCRPLFLMGDLSADRNRSI